VEKGSGEDVVFVGGCMRSGTSLLHRVLCQSGDTNPFVQACFYLTHQLKLYHHFCGEGRLFATDYFGDGDGLMEFTQDTVLRFLDQTRERWNNPRRLVLKQTELTYFFPLLARLLPGAGFAVSVRDPRDTIASMIEVGQRQRRDQLTSPFARAGRDVQQLCQIYNGVYAGVLRGVDANEWAMRDRTLFVRYEDVVRDTAATLQKLGAFFGLSLDDFQQDRRWKPDGVAEQVKDHRFWSTYLTDLSGGEISDQSVGKHKRLLSDLDLVQVNMHCAAIQTRFGYE
jgi:Sulfotransferase family